MTAAAAACERDGMRPHTSLTLRPLFRRALLAAVASSSARDAATGLALKYKPTGALHRLKRAVQTELRWQAREMVQMGRTLRRCCSGSCARASDPGRAFRLVPAQGSGAADRGSDFLAALGAPGAVQSVVVVQLTWNFGYGRGARDAASVWRAQLRCEEPLAALEASLCAALRATAEGELANIGAVAVALLDDSPHASLDKKRPASLRYIQGEKEPAGSEAPSTPRRSTGLAHAVTRRLGALVHVSGAGLASPRVSRRSEAPSSSMTRRLGLIPETVVIDELPLSAPSPSLPSPSSPPSPRPSPPRLPSPTPQCPPPSTPLASSGDLADSDSEYRDPSSGDSFEPPQVDVN